MTLTTGVDAKWVLFEKFRVETGSQLFFGMLFVFMLAITTEALSFGLWHIQFNTDDNKASKNIPSKIMSSILYGLIRVLNYSQMLVVMTYNLWLMVAVAAS